MRTRRLHHLLIQRRLLSRLRLGDDLLEGPVDSRIKMKPPPSPARPQSDDDPLRDTGLPEDVAPVWNPPDWFAAVAVVDWGAEAEADAPPAAAPTPPPSPPPPPRRNRKKRQGNPNWVRGGSMEGSNWLRRSEMAPEPEVPPMPPRRRRDPSGAEPAVLRRRRTPNVSAILSHLGIQSPFRNSPLTHECSQRCKSVNSP